MIARMFVSYLNELYPQNHMSFTSSRLFAEVSSLSPKLWVYSPIDRETHGGNLENDVSNLALIEQSAEPKQCLCVSRLC